MSAEEQAQRHVGSVVLPGRDDRRHREAQLSRFDEHLEFGDAAQKRQLPFALWVPKTVSWLVRRHFGTR